MQLGRILDTIMKGFIIVALCAHLVVVYSSPAWQEDFQPIIVHTATGQLPPKYYPLTSDDFHATRKAATFVHFIKIVPQLNPLILPVLGPYHIALPQVNFKGLITLSNVVVHGLNTMLLPQLEVRMAPSRIDFNVSVPIVSASVNYNLDATLGGKNIHDSGTIYATLDQLHLSVAVGPKIVGQSYVVENADVNIDLKHLMLQMANSEYSEQFRPIVKQFLNNPQQYSGIVDDLLRTVLQAISHELKQITANEILQYLMSKPSTRQLLG